MVYILAFVLCISLFINLYLLFKYVKFKKMNLEGAYFKSYIVDAKFNSIIDRNNKKLSLLDFEKILGDEFLNVKTEIERGADYWSNFEQNDLPNNKLVELEKKTDTDYHINLILNTNIPFINRFYSFYEAVEQNSASIVLTNPEGNIIYVNKGFSNLTGYTKKEALGQNPRILKSGEQNTDYYEKLWNTISQKKAWEGEFHNKKKNGNLYWEKALITPILNQDGEIISYMALKENITELKENKKEIENYIEKLEDLNNTKDKLFSIIAHDLKNPFSVIKGLIELVNSKVQSTKDENLIRQIGLMTKASDQFYDLLQNLLRWSQAQRGKIQAQIQRVEISEVFDKEINLLQYQAKKKGVFIQNVCFPPFYIESDANLLSIIFRNLINNAVKFSEAGDIVRLNAYKEDDTFYMEVKDEGIGMTEEQVSQFYKEKLVSTYGTNNEKGTGVGLSMVLKFVELLNLEIKIESEVNRGTKFIIMYSIKENSDEKN